MLTLTVLVVIASLYAAEGFSLGSPASFRVSPHITMSNGSKKKVCPFAALSFLLLCILVCIYLYR